MSLLLVNNLAKSSWAHLRCQPIAESLFSVRMIALKSSISSASALST